MTTYVATSTSLTNGIYAVSNAGTVDAGNFTSSSSSHAIVASSSATDCIYATCSAASASALVGINTGNGNGIFGRANALYAYGVGGSHTAAGNGVYGVSVSGSGVYGQSSNSIGVTGNGVTYGTYGITSSSGGVGAYGNSSGANGIGVYGYVSGSSGIGVFGYNTGSATYAGYFIGNVGMSGNTTCFNLDVTNSLTKPGGSFLIDHPLDPQNKDLYHSFVESPERKNIYDGVDVADASGEISVQMPAYFDALNDTFRYQLTAIGGAAPGLHIKEELSNGKFVIAGANAGQKVCWQVTGNRKDAWALAHPLTVEADKSADMKGFFRHPVEHGQPAEMGIPSKVKLPKDAQ